MGKISQISACNYSTVQQECKMILRKNCLKLPKNRRFPAVGSRPHPASGRKCPVTRRAGALAPPWRCAGVAGFRVGCRGGLQAAWGTVWWPGCRRAAYTPPLRTHKRRQFPAVGSRPHPASGRKFPVTRRAGALAPSWRCAGGAGFRVGCRGGLQAARGNVRWPGCRRAAYTPPLRTHKRRQFPAVGSRPHPASGRKFPVTRRAGALAPSWRCAGGAGFRVGCRGGLQAARGMCGGRDAAGGVYAAPTNPQKAAIACGGVKTLPYKRPQIPGYP